MSEVGVQKLLKRMAKLQLKHEMELPEAPKDCLQRLPPETDGPHNRGKYRVELTEDGYEYVFHLVSNGISQRTVARKLGIAWMTWLQMKKRSPQLIELLDAARGAMEDRMTGKLMQMADKGNVVAAIYYSKAKLGWREGDAPERHAPVHIHIPGPMHADEYKKMREAGATPMQLPEPKLEADWGPPILDTVGKDYDT